MANLCPDLLSRKNNTFQVKFDLLNPRAHFIIVPRDDKKWVIQHDLNDLRSEPRRKLVQAASTMIDKYKLDKFTTVLSVHRGSWINSKEQFHVHICTDVESYLGIFNSKEKEIPGWPSTKFTKKWKASKDPKKYTENVKAYPVKSYYDDELQQIEMIIENNDEKVRQVETSYKSYKLVYHPSEPKVGFVKTTSDVVASLDDHVQVLNAMNEFAGLKKLTNVKSKDENQGCHLCVVFNLKDHGFELQENQTLHGYIPLTGPKFYEDFCPDDMKEVWFQRFRSLGDYKVYT